TNMVQMNALCSTTVLTVGLSLTDPNMRRLLNASSRAPKRRQHFAILKESDYPIATSEEVHELHQRAVEQAPRFEREGAGVFDEPETGLAALISQIRSQDRGLQERVFRSMGVEPIWIQDFGKIPKLLQRIW